jgi:hypothetical protein
VTLGAFRHITAIALLQAGVDTAAIAVWLGTPISVTGPHRQRRERPATLSASVTGDTHHRHGAAHEHATTLTRDHPRGGLTPT